MSAYGTAPGPCVVEPNEGGEGVAAAATTAITVLAVVSVLIAGGATAIYLFGGIQ